MTKILKADTFPHEIPVHLPVAEFHSPDVANLYEGASRFATFILSYLAEHHHDDDDPNSHPSNSMPALMYAERNLALEIDQWTYGGDLIGKLEVDEKYLTLTGGMEEAQQYSARWTHTGDQKYTIDAVNGTYPTVADGWQLSKPVPVSKAHYNLEPRFIDIEQNPALRAALYFDSLMPLLYQRYEYSDGPDLGAGPLHDSSK